jgi:hypothetical protein
MQGGVGTVRRFLYGESIHVGSECNDSPGAFGTGKFRYGCSFESGDDAGSYPGMGNAEGIKLAGKKG